MAYSVRNSTRHPLAGHMRITYSPPPSGSRIVLGVMDASSRHLSRLLDFDPPVLSKDAQGSADPHRVGPRARSPRAAGITAEGWQSRQPPGDSDIPTHP